MKALHRYQNRERSLLKREKVLYSILFPPTFLETAELHALTEETLNKKKLLDRCRCYLNALDPLPAPPQLAEVKELSTVIASMHAIARAQKPVSAREAALRLLLPHPELSDLRHLQTIIGELDHCYRRIAHTESASIKFSELPSPPDLLDLIPMDELIAVLAAKGEQAEFERIRLEVLNRVDVPPELLSPRDLEQTTGALDFLEDALKRLEVLRRDLAEALALKRDEIANALKEAGNCPLCGHLLDLTHFLEGSHD
jgi:hypothetical protein